MEYYGVYNSISLDGNGLPIIPGVDPHAINFVGNGSYQVYGDLYHNTSTGRWNHYLLAVLYNDPSGKWIVGTNDQTILNSLGEYESLDTVVDNDPKNWHTYKTNSEYDESGEYETQIFEIDNLNKGLLIAMSKANPHAVGLWDVAGLKATVPTQVGNSFRPDEIETDTTWYGENGLEAFVEKIDEEINLIKNR